MNSTRVNWRQAGSEAFLIFLGVGVALLGQAWWEFRADRDAERHILEGIRNDLELDGADLRAVIQSAERRVAATDYLLSRSGDTLVERPFAPLSERNQRPGVPTTLDEALAAVRETSGVYPGSLAGAMSRLGSIAGLDLADVTYREAVASGQLAVVRDPELRATIAKYYFDAVALGQSNDERMEANSLQLRVRLADSGLSPEGVATDESILAALATNPGLRAELSNQRGLALRQIRFLGVIDYDRAQLASELDDWLIMHGG